MTPPDRLRSLLYLPASNPRHLRKIPSLTADRIAIDLEDGVAPDAKPGARHALEALRAAGGLTGDRWMLRVNAADTPWHRDDLELADRLEPPAVILPKAEARRDVDHLAERLAVHAPWIGLVIETALGVARLMELASHPRVRWLIFGSADFRRSIGAPPSDDRLFETQALSSLVLAARACHCAAVDSVYFRFRDPEGLRRHAAHGRALGFDAKSCIHPAQVAPIHEVFASTPEEVAWARAVRLAWEREDGAANGVVVVEGEMIEALHLQVADRILERADKDEA